MDEQRFPKGRQLVEGTETFDTATGLQNNFLMIPMLVYPTCSGTLPTYSLRCNLQMKIDYLR